MSKKILELIFVLPFIFYCCDYRDKSELLGSRGYNSLKGKVNIDLLSNFHLTKDTLVVVLDSTGHIVLNFHDGCKYLIQHRLIKSAELYKTLPKGKKSASRMNICIARKKQLGFIITLQEGVLNDSPETISLNIMDSIVDAKYIFSFYESGKTVNYFDVRTDYVRVTFEKYPLKKGDIIRGYLCFKGWKIQLDRNNKRQYEDDKIVIEGFFECKLE
jgi:hypothetical protein